VRAQVMAQFGLREEPAHLKGEQSGAAADPQSYALGVKEVWRVPEEQCKPGLVVHTWGWPLTDMKNPSDTTYGGAFLYHMAPDLVLCGFVTGLDYGNPYVSPYLTFQQWKTHEKVKAHLEGGECISYGARVLNEGGYYAIPKLTFPGGALLGCSAGFLNAMKIKGSHTALKSGMVAADAVRTARAAGRFGMVSATP
jgi:electron-transferring-flavoprotein dehydrogenase